MSRRQNSTPDTSRPDGPEPSSSQPSQQRAKRKNQSKIEDRYEYLRDLTKRSCQVYTVSKLFNLDQSEQALKRCSKILRERIQGVLFSATKDYRVKAGFKIRKELAETVHDHDAISIQVEVTPLVDSDEEEEPVSKLLYDGYLICRGRRKRNSHVAQLPILLTFKGTARVLVCVNSTLELLFDCLVRPIYFSSSEMQLFFTFCLFESKEALKNLVLGYSLPGFAKNDLIEIRMGTESIENLRKRINDIKYTDLEAGNSTAEELFERFFDSIEDSHKTKIRSCTLRRFKMQDIILHNSGKFLVDNTALLASFLKMVCQLMLDREILDLSGTNLKDL